MAQWSSRVQRTMEVSATIQPLQWALTPSWSPSRQNNGFFLYCSSAWASVDNMQAKTDILYIILHNNSLVIDAYLSVVNCIWIAPKTLISDVGTLLHVKSESNYQRNQV